MNLHMKGPDIPSETPQTPQVGVHRCLICTALVPRGQSRCAEHRIRRVRGSANQQRRRALVIGHPCARCGALATELDHVIALARGGTEAWSNLQPLCRACHQHKTSTEGRA